MKQIVGEIGVDDNDIRRIPFHVGCTACVILITKHSIFCANAGDSRAILALKNKQIVELSYDHKPDNQDEEQRIKRAGGFVEHGRAQGIISVSRAIGDWRFKDPSLLKIRKTKK